MGRKVRPRKPTPLEWVGGHFPIPGVVTDEAEAYHVELLIWLEFPSGLIVGYDMMHAGQVAGSYGTSLRDAMKKPLSGPPRRPDRVRVATEAAAVEVRGIVGPGTVVAVEATHEIDALAADFQAHAQRSLRPADGEEEHQPGDFTSGSYLQGGLVPPESIEDLFRGAGILKAMAPWKLLQDRQIVRLDIPALDVHGAAVLVLWKEVRRRGFVIFPDPDSFFAMADHAEQFGHDAPDVPGTPMLSLLFTKLEDLRERARQEIERFGWSDAKSEFPWVDFRDRHGNLVPVDRRNIEIVSAVAWTLGTFCMKNEAALTLEWEDAASMSIDSGDRPTVRYTIPYAAYDEFESRPDPGHHPRRPLRPAGRRAGRRRRR